MSNRKQKKQKKALGAFKKNFKELNEESFNKCR